MKNPTFRILRLYADSKHGPDIIKTGLSEAEAKAHCRDPETSSRTCSTTEGMERTREKGHWFHGFSEEI